MCVCGPFDIISPILQVQIRHNENEKGRTINEISLLKVIHWNLNLTHLKKKSGFAIKCINTKYLQIQIPFVELNSVQAVSADFWHLK